MSEELSPAREAARKANKISNGTDREDVTMAGAFYMLAAELRADRLARQEQHDELMVMLGDIARAVRGKPFHVQSAGIAWLAERAVVARSPKGGLGDEGA